MFRGDLRLGGMENPTMFLFLFLDRTLSCDCLSQSTIWYPHKDWAFPIIQGKAPWGVEFTQRWPFWKASFGCILSKNVLSAHLSVRSVGEVTNCRRGTMREARSWLLRSKSHLLPVQCTLEEWRFGSVVVKSLAHWTFQFELWGCFELAAPTSHSPGFRCGTQAKVILMGGKNQWENTLFAGRNSKLLFLVSHYGTVKDLWLRTCRDAASP